MANSTTVLPGPTMPDLLASSTLRTLFNIIVIGPGLIGLPMLLLAVIFGEKTRRGAVFISFIFATTVLAFSGAMLPLAGQQGYIKPPDKSLCYVQTAIMDGAVAMTSFSSLALVLQLAYGLYQRRYMSSKGHHERAQMWFNVTLILVPFVAFLAFVIADVYYFVQIAEDTPLWQNVTALNPAFYCKLVTIDPFAPLKSNELPLVLFIITMSVTGLLVEAVTGYLLWRYWRHFQDLSQQEGTTVATTFPIASLIRLTIFTLYRIALVGVALQVVGNPNMFVTAEFLHGAGIPLVVFLVFGLQKDVVQTWVGWVKGVPGLVMRIKRRSSPRY
ncbi:hypothetical protein BKA62DRAFT_831723 [Auriculariales sp. MPI-PUGE-AT-0066]|nr:hypothetical protein BKA62DRAFT_831723 [Auriculariales sp. MPI-PUGE-AT-0066]